MVIPSLVLLGLGANAFDESIAITVSRNAGGNAAWNRYALTRTLDDVLADNNIYNFKEDTNFALQYLRTFKNTNWQALYVPFDLEVGGLPAGVEVAVLEEDPEALEGVAANEVCFRKLKAGETLPAHSIGLIRSSRTGDVYIPGANLRAVPR